MTKRLRVNHQAEAAQSRVRAASKSVTLKSELRGQPLEAETIHDIQPRFGHTLDNIRVHHDADAAQLSREFGAAAFTVGQDIYFADGNYAPQSALGRQLLAHEIAHALQQRNVWADRTDYGQLSIPARDSKTETEAHAAASSFGHGDAISLSTSSEPTISRWEGGEHKRAVDEAMQTLGAAGKVVDPNVAAQLKTKVKLANGLEVTPGQITAMMGDLYGQFDKEGHFDPGKSFEQLNNADPKEMSKLIKLIDKEAATGEASDASDLEKATRNRRGNDGSYLELAAKNNSHFSKPNADGTDNNMGAYAAFHKMALEAAEKGDMNTARALEASGGHFLTDRFAAGHNFDKEGVMKASGFESGGALANMAVKTAHDDMNANGIAVNNDPDGPGWTAYGDGKWKSDENAVNRLHTAGAVYDSWSELQNVHDRKSSAADLTKAGFSALKDVPQFDQKNQDRAEAVARTANVPGMLWNYKDQLPDGLASKFWRYEGKVENAVEDGIGWVGDKAGQAWDWTTQKASDAADWTADKAKKAWNWTTNAASDAVDWAGDKAGQAWDWTTQKASDAADWTADKAKRAWNWTTSAASDAVDWTANTADKALDVAGDAASAVGDAAGSVMDGISDLLSDDVSLFPKK